MFDGTSWGKTLDILQRSMSVNQLRQQVIANNISNVNTPNFKRSEVTYETALRRALESEKEVVPLKGRYTDDKHIRFEKNIDYRDVRPSRVLDFLTTSNVDGNNVDIEVEANNYIKEQLRYEMLVESVNHQFRSMKIVLGG